MAIWTQTDDDTFTATREDGLRLTARVVPDEDPGITMEDFYGEEAFTAWGVIVEATAPTGHKLDPVSVWGVTFLETAPFDEACAYIEELADDLSDEFPPLADLARLMLPSAP